MTQSGVNGEIEAFLRKLFPMRRSITGQANRETLQILREIVDIDVHEIPSGRKVFDWTVPDEWSVREAWIEDSQGQRIVDFEANALHLVGYSVAVDALIPWKELAPHIHRHKELPHAIPYRTSYYTRDWGFSVTRDQFEQLRAAVGNLRVRIDADHFAGSLTYGEVLIPGNSPREILISSYICHPYMANDGLSGMLLTAFLARYISDLPSRSWSYRIIFVPETIGAISYLHENQTAMSRVEAGLEITTVGGPGEFGVKKTWDATHWLNDLIEGALAARGKTFRDYPFDIHGADERQFSSQGFRINVGTVSKDRYYEYPEYHSSADDLDLVTPAAILESLEVYQDIVTSLEALDFYKNVNPSGEVMLSKHGLYPTLGGAIRPSEEKQSELQLILWLLFHLDGHQPLAAVAKKMGSPEHILRPLLEQLASLDLIRKV